MHDDLSIVPVGAVPEGQEYRFVARQNLRAMTTNRQVQRNENLRRATGGGNAQDTDPMLPEKNGIVSPPARAQWTQRLAQANGRPALDENLSELAVHPESYPLPVRREERISCTAFGAANGNGLCLVQGTQVDLLIGTVDEARTVRGKGHDVTS